MYTSRPAHPLFALLATLLLVACGESPPPGEGAATMQPAAPASTVQAQAVEPATGPAAGVDPGPVARPAMEAKPPAAAIPSPESLLESIGDPPFEMAAPAPAFGDLPANDWLATRRRPPAAAPRLLPDLFAEPGQEGRVNVDSELLLDGSHGTSRILDGVGMKITISTD